MSWHEILYQVLNTINNVVLYFIGIPFLLQLIYMLFFWVKKKVYPKSNKFNRVAIIIAARNEEDVIFDTVKALRTKQTYPSDKYDIYVVAHNCTDRTSELAKKAGATVFVCNDDDPSHRMVCYALKYGFQELLKQGKKYDFVLRFDADNHVNDEFISLMNDAYNDGVKIARPYESALNIDQSTYTKACGLYYIFDSRFSSRVRERFHIDAHVNGPGSMTAMEIIERLNGYDANTICEDTEFNFNRMLEGYRCHFVEDAIVYEDLPSTFKDTYARNLRLGAGNIRLLGKYTFKFIGKFFTTFRFSFIEQLLTYIFIPICVVLCTWLPAFYIYDVIYLAVTNNMETLYLTLIIIAACLLFLFFFAGILQGALLVILDYKKMGVKRRRDLLSGIFLFPCFSVVYIVTITLGVFSKPKWIKVNRNSNKEKIKDNK